MLCLIMSQQLFSRVSAVCRVRWFGDICIDDKIHLLIFQNVIVFEFRSNICQPKIIGNFPECVYFLTFHFADLPDLNEVQTKFLSSLNPSLTLMLTQEIG